MEDNNVTNVPYIVFESMQARMERTIKRLIIVIIIVISMLFASNAIWLYVWSQYDYSYEQVEVDSEGDGNANYIGRDLNGELNNGESYGYENPTNTESPKGRQ